MIGTTLSHYEITGELGRGGMGIVYKARDTKLDRTVAIKVLPSAALASNDDRERFYREAKSAAQLHHPHIASVFEIDEAVPEGGDSAEPRPFIAMEYIAGETLHEMVARGPLKLADAIQVATQVADALKAAHSKEIVHRDIKSANVMINEDGVAKVLDFGLAKTNQSTMLTRMGSTLGTVAYMSPEQARGDEVDGRTDLYSLGTMLYEMVAGKQPFAGEYEQAVIYSILNEPPEPLTSVRTGVPMQLEWIVDKLLAKDADYRYQTAADLMADLKSVDLSGSGQSRRSMPAMSAAQSAPPATAATAIPGRYSKIAVPVWVTALLLPIGLALGWLLFHDSGEEPLPPRATKQLTLRIPDAAWAGDFAITSDGRTLVASVFTQGGIGIHRIDLRTSETALLVPNVNALWRSLSYDDEWFAWSDGNTVSRVRVRGGTPVSMLQSDQEIKGITWLPDGSMLVVEGDSLYDKLLRIPASGTAPEVVMTGSEEAPRLLNPVSLHNLDRIAISVESEIGTDHMITLVDLSTGELTTLNQGFPIAYSLSGHLLYAEGNTDLLARAFDYEQATFLGPATIIENSSDYRGIMLDEHGTYYSTGLVANGPELVGNMTLYTDGSINSGFDVTLNNTSAQPRISPDGKRVMIRTNIEEGQILIEYNMQTGVSRQFTIPAEGDADNVAYSPDGEVIFFESDNRLFRRNRNRSGELEEFETPAGVGSIDWSNSGKHVVFVGGNVGGFAELYLLDVETREVIELDGGDGIHGWPRFSPDDRYISFGTNDLDGQSIWVMSVEDGSLHLVSEPELTPTVNRHPMTAWGDGGDYLYYTREAGVKRKPVTADPYFEITGAEEDVLPKEVIQFDISADGSSMIAVSRPTVAGGVFVEVAVLTDFHTELRQTAPALEN